MGHSLEPKSGTLPPVQTVIELLTAAFPYVRVDREAGLKSLQRHIQWIEQANPAAFLGRHAEALARAADLKRVDPNDVLWVEFGDDVSNTRHFTIWPGESIQFGYRGDEDELLARPILERCAEALNCNLVSF
jgi:hypothetical protein